MSTVNHVPPMLAAPGEPPAGPGWAFELKWDGQRVEAAVLGGKVRLTSRNGKAITRSYPELAALADVVGEREVLLDGEIVALGDDGYPDIERLQRRMHVQRPTVALVRQVPVYLFVFDVLHFDGTTTVPWTYRQRRELLARLQLDGKTAVVQVPPSYSDVTGAELLDVAREHGMEGIVAKRLGSSYKPGRRSDHWVKTVLRTTHEVLVCGWRTGEGRTLGALMMGAYDRDGRLRYLGDVGSGLSAATLRGMQKRLAALVASRSPFDEPVSAYGAHWVRPELVGEVKYRGTTRNGRLRYPAWRMLRADKAPAEVVVIECSDEGAGNGND